MQETEELKPLNWIGSSKRDYDALPREVASEMGFALFRAQQGFKHPDAKPLKGFGGAGVVEIIADHRSATFRCV